MSKVQKMNPEVKEKWIAALRSGEYEQTKGVLKKENKYCCLGVLCDLFKEDTKRGGWSFKWYEDWFEVDEFQEECFPPPPVIEWAGTDPAIRVQVGKKLLSVTNLNDGVSRLDIPEHDFNQIADIIEEQL